MGVTGVMACSLAFAAAPDSDKPAHAQWRKSMMKIKPPSGGCFQATFPSTLWELAPCRAASVHAHPLPHPLPRIRNLRRSQTTGDGNDYALVANGLISETVGSFPSVNNVTSESSVGVPAFGGGGILGPNEYTLQINTNANSTSSACSGGASGCTVWQQFIYATDYETTGSAAVFMQYWLLGYGAQGAACPGGYYTSGTSCYRNSSSTSAPNVPITDLGSLTLTATAVSGGDDTVTFANGTQAYSVSEADSVLEIGTVWNESEFNIVGNAGGSQAVFNPGAAITVNVAAQFGSTAAPGCASNAGTTGETNNLNLGPCTTAGGATPSIQFTESSSQSASADTLPSGASLAPNEHINSQSGRFQLILQDDGNLVLYDLPSGSALWASGTNGQSVATCIMQTDGNLVLYSPSGAAVWASNTYGNSGAYLVVQNDGNVVIYTPSGAAVWATNTVQP